MRVASWVLRAFGFVWFFAGLYFTGYALSLGEVAEFVTLAFYTLCGPVWFYIGYVWGQMAEAEHQRRQASKMSFTPSGRVYPTDRVITKEDVSKGDTVCQECGMSNPCWNTTNELWNAAWGNEGGVLCPGCFVKLYEIKTGDLRIWRLEPLPKEPGPRLFVKKEITWG